MADADIVIVGAGSVGMFAAHALLQRGLGRVLVIDRAGLAAGTSRASDGNLLMSDKSPGVIFDLMRRSLTLWRATIDEIGNSCEFDVKGSVVVTLDPRKVASLADHVAVHAAAGIRAELHQSDFTRFEPDLTAETRAVGIWPDDVQVNPMLACYGLARDLKARGVSFRFYDGVTRIDASPDGVALNLASGARIAAGHLVLAAGVWSPALLAPLGIRLPVVPRKGHIAVIERGGLQVRSKIADFAYNDTVEEADPDDPATQTAAIIEMTRSGTILCGSSRAFVGFDAAIDQPTLARILKDCIRMVPGLADLRVIRAYMGFRPYPLDGMPLIGFLPAAPRILVATGHEGAGHGLAPATAELVAAILAGERPKAAAPFDPARFA